VPAGGTAGQFLTKIDGTNYNTDWTTINVSSKRDLTDYDFTNVTDTKLDTFGLTIDALTTEAWTCDSFLKGSELQLTTDTSANGGQVGEYFQTKATVQKVTGLFKSFGDVDGIIVLQNDLAYALDYNGLTFGTQATNPESGTNRYLRSSIVFSNGSTQTIAFPGFANAALTGNPTAPTAALGDNDTSIATTAFVQQELLSGTANARNLEVYVRNQSGSTIPAGSIVYISGATGNLPLITLAQANNDANSAQTIGFVKTAIADNGTGYVIVRGVLEAIDTSALTEGVQLYLSPTTAGTWTTTKPSAPDHLVYVGIVIRSHPTQGTILVAVQNGYELHELHDVALSSEANNDLLVYELSTDLWKNKSFATLGLATLASPAFTGTPSLPTGTTAVTQSAGNNTTALATTAFVQTSNPDASTTTKGHVELATDAEVIAGTSTTLALVANNYRIAGLTTNIWAPGVTGLSALSSGTGANTGSTVSSLNGAMVAPNASTAGYATRGFTVGYPSNNVNTGYNFGTASGHSVRVYINTQWASTIAGVKMRGVFGRSSATLAVPATLAARAYGWEWDFSSRTMNIIAHDGTTLTTTAVTWNPANGRTYEITATSNGSGTISLYVDGTLLGTSSGGPTGTVSTALIWWQYEIQNEATAGAQVITQYANPKVYTTNG